MSSVTKKYVVGFIGTGVILAVMTVLGTPVGPIVVTGVGLLASLATWYILAVKKERKKAGSSEPHNDASVIVLCIAILIVLLASLLLKFPK